MVRDARHPARAGLSRQPVSADHRGHDDPGGVQLLVLRAHHAGQKAAGHLAGQGDGVAARHFSLHHDHDHLHLFGGAWRPRGHPGGADPVRLDPDGLDDRAQSLRRHHHRRLRRRCRCDHRRTGARHHRNLRCRLYFSALQGRLCFPGAGAVSGVPASGHLWRTRRGESMSAPSENMPITVPATRAKPLLIRHLPYFIGAAIVVALAATMRFDGYILNILMQATTFAIAVFGLSVVLGLCGQINLAQAAFFGFGAYAVGIGTSDYHISYWLCLVAGCLMALVAGAVLGMSTLRLGGHYLAMLALVGYFVWHLPDTRLGRAMRAVRDNELAAGVVGIDVFRTKVYAFALSAVLGGLAGGLFAGGFAYVSPDQFSFAESVVFLTMSLLGGVASPIGSAIGTGLLILIPEWLRFLKSVPGLYLAIYGLAVILIIRYMPDGIWGFVNVITERWRAQTKAPPAVATLQLKPATVGGDTVLEVTGLSKYFGGLKAVDGVDISVKRGGVHALIGPNGSGKTTTLNVLSGLYKATAGKVILDGTDVTDMPPHLRTAAGLGRTFQNIRLFRSMTALENVIIGAERPGNALIGEGGDAALTARAIAALNFVGLGPRANQLISSFSYGHQRLIEIARALAANPTLLLLDEPAAGLNSSEKLELHALLKRIAAQGLTILIIDHDMTLVSEAAQHITVLNFGRRIADGESMAVLRHPDVVSAYLGTE